MTEIIILNDDGIAKGAKILRNGGLVAFPTETVYGLGADATNDHAVAGIYEAKGRPSFNPLIIHLPNLKDALHYADFNDMALQLADQFWPGALTLVVPLKPKSKLSKLVSAGLDTVAIRVPAHGGARDLLRVTGTPIAAPSANTSGRLSPTTASHVSDSLNGKVDIILDGGPCQVGLESTIIDCSTDRVTLLRPGGIAAEVIEHVIGKSLIKASSDDHTPKSPGMLASHYAPNCPIRLNVAQPKDGEVYLGFGECPDADLNLSPDGDLRQAAANLFNMLHELDQKGAVGIAVSPIPNTGLGLAINDRLTRAAAPR